MQNYFIEFQKHLLVKKGISQVTINVYVGSLKPVFKRTNSLNPTHEQIVDYISFLHENNYSYNHIINTSLALEHWTKFKDNPIKLGRPKKPYRIIRDTLSEAEITRMIAKVKNIREKAIICLLAYSGIRNKELCGLKVCDVNLGDNLIRVICGKNKSDRIVNISGDCSRVLVEYLNIHRRTPEDYLFTTYQGYQYTSYALRKLIKILANRAEIQKRVYPHLFRHSLATNLLRRGCQLNIIQKQLGHAWISSTEIYIRSFPHKIQANYNLFQPSYI